MPFGRIIVAALLFGVLAATFPISASALTESQKRCSLAIGKAGRLFVKSKLKLFQQCANADLEDGSCESPDYAALAKIDKMLETTLRKRCPINAPSLKALGFPGPCSDANRVDGFTRDDLYDCIRTSHDAIMSKMVALQYDSSVSGPLAIYGDLVCQRAVAKQSSSLVTCVLKSIQNCRGDILKGRLRGVPAILCASLDPKTVDRITKCHGKMRDELRRRCDDVQVGRLKVCVPDQKTVGSATSCLAEEHVVLVEGPEITVPPDLVDYEYAVRGGLCGDGVVNDLDEECDGADDEACPGMCGTARAPDGYFACLCKNKSRLRVVEHADADVDTGWTGNSADNQVVEGGGYLVDLYDCDASGLCNVGPHCSAPPYEPCGVAATAPSGTTGNSICTFFQEGVCRKERTAVGPHCFRDIQKKCDPRLASDPVCDAAGDFCAVTLTAAPNPVASGGVTACNVSVFSEDVVGVANILTGEATVKAPHLARTYNPAGSANKPCPVCGGFCSVSRERCEVAADCEPGTGACITAPVCSDGPNIDKACRPGVPFGSPVPFFGTTSIDCPPDPMNQILGGGGIDLKVTHRTTSTVAMPPTTVCSGAGFTGNACLGGTSAGRPCATASECPGGSCAPQCFCSGQVKPNACFSACLGGPNDSAGCITDSECPGGFCHAADCRVDPSDLDSIQEGICTAGPLDGNCSATKYRACSADGDCAATVCPFCEAGETCVFTHRACFVNSGIVRQGSPRTPEGGSAGIYCISASTPAVDTVAGFPGPNAFTQPELTIVVP